MKIYTKKELYEAFPYLTASLVCHIEQMKKITKIKRGTFEVDEEFLQSFDYKAFWAKRKEEANKKRSINISKSYQNKTEEEKQQFRQKCSKAVTKVWASYSKEDKDARCAAQKEIISKSMKTLEARQHCREGQLNWWSRAPKEWNERRIAKIKDTIRTTYATNGEDILGRIHAIKMKNGSYSTSKAAKDSTIEIEKAYPNTNRWHCDAYIVELDMWIEFHYFWTHYKEPFDKNNEEHLKILQELKKKSEQGHRQSRNAIYLWTNLDVKKRQCAIDNNLKYYCFYSPLQFKEFLIRLKELVQ